jgi:hypothetical protein
MAFTILEVGLDSVVDSALETVYDFNEFLINLWFKLNQTSSAVSYYWLPLIAY